MVAALALLLTSSVSALGVDCAVDDPSKIDCGYVGITEQGCVAKGCCWKPASSGAIPWCFYGGDAPTTCFKSANSTNAPFSASEISTMKKFFLANINIQGQGGVVASPDLNTPGGSYYYHWERDGALTMRVLYENWDATAADPYMKAYVGWVTRMQARSDPNNVDIRVEVKYNLPDGSVFTGGWCRPQTDAPGLRAATLIPYAERLLAGGQSAYVKQNLWTGSSAMNGGAIKYDLDWVAANWTQDGCDLWEEIRSNDFFWNRFTFRRALLLGAKFATTMGDSSSASRYRDAAAKIEATLSSHWNGVHIFESSNRQKDTAVITGLNFGYAGDSVFGPTDKQVASTIKTFNNLFCTSYTINQKDFAANVPGVLYGRYQGDSYAGGNPWILLTAALAQLFYRGATAVIENGVLDSETSAAWMEVFNLPANTQFHSAFHLAQAFSSAGDGVMLRIRKHVEGDGFHLAEQLDRNTGFQYSAKDLTWSYAEVLQAAKARATFVAKAKAAFPQEAAVY